MKITTKRGASLAVIAASAALSAAAPAQAQQPDNSALDAARRVLSLEETTQGGAAVLEADQILYDRASDVVTAVGNVEIYYGGRTVQADQVSYNASTDEIKAQGAVRLINPDGSVVEADAAEFDSQLSDGLIQGARAVLADGRARIAAVEGRRVDGKYTTLSKAVFSPCKVCEEDPTPLWRIRARRITQDEEAKDIIYEDAYFDVFGVPVGYLPVFSHADPSVKRRTGFLTPDLFSTQSLGFSAKVPYFYEIDPSQDFTITPFISTEENPVLEGEYRAALTEGEVTAGGSITYSRDDLERGFRGHFTGEGEYYARDGFVIGFDADVASDDAYLRRYRYNEDDRLQARIFAERYTDDGFISLESIRYQSFREDEPVSTIPLIAPLFEFEQSFDAPSILGGEFTLGGGSLYLRRTNNNSLAPDVTAASNRDVVRLTGNAGWSRTDVTSGGVVLESFAKLRADAYYTYDDPNRNDDVTTRILPTGGVRASLPLGKIDGDVEHILEPIGSLVWAPYGGNSDNIPNEDSQDAELDELNIFDESRLAGIDRWEDGPRATVGLRYQRRARNGLEAEVAVGQSYRLRQSGAFSENSGLADNQSDFVGAWRLTSDEDFSVAHRFRVDPEGIFRRNEVHASAQAFDRFRVSSSYVFLDDDAETGAVEDRSEFHANAEVDITQHWTLAGNMRRDLEQSRFVTAGGALRYADECVEIDFSIRRRFNEVDDVPPSTDFGIAIRLLSVDAQ